MTLSVIIPIHNAASTVRQAVRSVTKLGTDVEVICVDDGSTDASAAIVMELQSGMPNIRLLRHQSSLGVSASRNTGLANATGSWIVFLDADDLISPDTEAMTRLGLALDADVDIVFFLHKVAGDLRRPHSYKLPVGLLPRGDLEELARNFLAAPKGHSVVSHCWGKIYRAAFLSENSIRFNEALCIYEDTEFVAKCLHRAGSGYFIPGCLYQYTPGQGLSTAFEHHPLDFISAITHLAAACGDAHLIPRATAAFMAKTLTLARSLPLRRRAGLCRKLALGSVSLDLHPCFVEDSSIRFILDIRLYRHPVSCALLLGIHTA